MISNRNMRRLQAKEMQKVAAMFRAKMPNCPKCESSRRVIIDGTREFLCSRCDLNFEGEML